MARFLVIISVILFTNGCSRMTPESYFFLRPQYYFHKRYSEEIKGHYLHRRKIFENLIFRRVLKKCDTAWIIEKYSGQPNAPIHYYVFSKDTTWKGYVAGPDEYGVADSLDFYPGIHEKEIRFVKNFQLDSLEKYKLDKSRSFGMKVIISRIIFKMGKIENVKMAFPKPYHIFVFDPRVYR